jgi:hypothetical protein
MINIWRDQRGQAMTETALLLPLLFLIVFGFLQLGIAIAEKQKLLYVTHYAVQVGSLTNNDLKIAGAIEEFYTGDDIIFGIESRDHVTDNVIPNTNRKYKDIVTVSLQKPFFLSIPFFEIEVINSEVSASAKVLCTNVTAPYTCE